MFKFLNYPNNIKFYFDVINTNSLIFLVVYIHIHLITNNFFGIYHICTGFLVI